jgi:hypothetical protein
LLWKLLATALSTERGVFESEINKNCHQLLRDNKKF